jgi:adenine/guanine/hypoxanthine permease
METTTKTQGTSGWDRYFHMTERGSNLGTEVRGGIVTFVTMAYIVVLNPLIVGTAKDINGNFPGGGQDIGEAISLVAAATALVAGIMTIFMGVLGRFPIAIAAGLGLNGFLAFGLAPYMTWPQAFGLVVIEGVIVLLIGSDRIPHCGIPRSTRCAEVFNRCRYRFVHRTYRFG